MKIKNILIGIISLLSFSIYSQNHNPEKFQTEANVSKIEITIETFDELKNFNWNMINEAFETNNPDQEISIRFMFENNEQTDKSETTVEKFNFAVSGKTSELNKLIEKLKNSVSKILEIQ